MKFSEALHFTFSYVLRILAFRCKYCSLIFCISAKKYHHHRLVKIIWFSTFYFAFIAVIVILWILWNYIQMKSLSPILMKKRLMVIQRYLVLYCCQSFAHGLL